MTDIFVRKHRYLEGEMERDVSFEGWFTITVRNQKEEKVKEYKFRNRITTIGLDRMGSVTQQVISHAFVGTGTATPSASDVSMGTFRAATSNRISYNQSTNVGVDHYVSFTQTWRFAAGAASGNLTEVGTGWSATSVNTLWSRQLILDGSGNPTTLTVLSNEYLDVTYELRAYPDLTIHEGTLSLTGGGSYAFKSRASVMQFWTIAQSEGGLYLFYGRPAARASQLFGTTLPTATATLPASLTSEILTYSGGTPQKYNFTNEAGTVDTYVPGSFYNTATSMTFGTTVGNFASGILGFSTDYSLVNSGRNACNFIHMVAFDDRIPKTIDNTINFRTKTSWAERILP